MPPTTPKSTSFLFHRGIRGKDSLSSFPRTPILARAVWAPSVTFGRLSGVAFDFTTRSAQPACVFLLVSGMAALLTLSVIRAIHIITVRNLVNPAIRRALGLVALSEYRISNAMSSQKLATG